MKLITKHYAASDLKMRNSVKPHGSNESMKYHKIRAARQDRRNAKVEIEFELNS